MYNNNVLILTKLFCDRWFIMWLLVNNYNNKMKNREYQKEIAEKNRHINTLTAEDKRHKNWYDLHDTLGHVFASLSLKSELAYH